MTVERWAVFGAVVLAALVVARIIDSRLAKRELPPEAVTRYRVLRRSVMATIVAIGLFSALLAIPAVRTVAGAVLGSAAIIGLVAGLAAQSTLANFVAGVLIAFTQPLRLGDRVVIDEERGTVEEIGLMYTLVRLDDASRLVIPNAKLASDTIRNATIVSREKVAEIAQRVEREAGAVGELAEQIQAHGVQIKDLDVGLLDFPWLREDEVVLLCWRLGEDEVAYWHGMDEGYAGRKPL